ncbi:hypothetical protein CLV98_12710 [Dyadobacter jejuensis]|uniref:Uncharacterized protein n=1 Tax=Dyadobacter jejuensis TaxID=1082580 RepID=A0A316A5C7_9BACT|nr:hypothetical protein CLV98_12710 [Dyadobacter jejuensis]
MKLLDIYRKVVSHFSTKSGLVNLSFYLIAAVVIWYLYDLKVLGILVLFFLSIFALSSFLSEMYFAFKGSFRGLDWTLTIPFVFVSITCLGAYYFLDLRTLGYIVVLSVIITCVTIFRS